MNRIVHGRFSFLTDSHILVGANNRYIQEYSNQNTMLEFTKKILRGVSFDAQLFQKELHKALKWITDAEEVRKFQEWCIVEFGSKYPIIIKKAFSQATTKA